MNRRKEVFIIEYEILGWPDDSPKLELDYREFSYAGKFVMTNTGKAVAKKNSEVVSAVSFNEDRTDPSTLWIRYITVRKDMRGEGIGPRLVSFLADKVLPDYERIKIAVNNPFAYEAMYKAGFEYTGKETGVAELVLVHSNSSSDDSKYSDGLDEFRSRDFSEKGNEFLKKKERGDDPLPEKITVQD